MNANHGLVSILMAGLVLTAVVYIGLANSGNIGQLAAGGVSSISAISVAAQGG